jgi:chemotaxis protein histidine kinase CheA
MDRMSRRKEEAAAIATFADHEVIRPPHKLRKAVTEGGEFDKDPIARAEAALADLSSEFADWMQAECDRLETARQTIKRDGFTPHSHDGLFRVAHDIKGQAATIGYPTVAGVAESLCRLMEHTPDMRRIPLPLVDQHVDAVRAIIREHARTDFADVASALTTRLRSVTDDFLVQENSHRPEYLESIFTPPLVPGG